MLRYFLRLERVKNGAANGAKIDYSPQVGSAMTNGSPSTASPLDECRLQLISYTVRKAGGLLVRLCHS